MPNEPIPAAAAMECGGSYNLHSRIPAGGAHLALPLLERATRNITLNGSDHAVVIADYGSSQGKNSLAPMRAAIRALRSRLGPDRPILVVHIDQAQNDFNTLFDVLHRDPDRYSADDPEVFPSAIGRSFYENVFPQEHVHLGWCSFAAIWLSRVPALVPGHFMSIYSRGEVRAAFDHQGAEDWKCFLSLRAAELRPNGRLVVVLPGLNDEGHSGLEDFFNEANCVLTEMVSESLITADERARMIVATYPRRRSHLLEPFNPNGQFHGLTVESCELTQLPDAFWADYQRDGKNEVLANRQAGFFRAIFLPSLALAFADADARRSFADAFEQKFKRRLSERPMPLHTFVQTMLLAKQGCTPKPTHGTRG